MTGVAVRGQLFTYKPHKDGGGTVTLQLSEPEWRQFLATDPQIWTLWATVRMNDGQPSDVGAGP